MIDLLGQLSSGVDNQESGTKMAVRQRRGARTRAMQLLYAFEQKHYEDDERLMCRNTIR